MDEQVIHTRTSIEQAKAHFACSHITFSYGGRLTLNDVSLRVERKDVIGLVGPNGAGKTTLLDVLTGRVRPDQGDVYLNGKVITNLPTFQRARLGIARTFQVPVVPLGLTVRETFQAVAQSYPPFLSEARIGETCDLVDLHLPADTITGTLETLARRKLLLASLLMRQPTVLLLDEPASGLMEDEIHIIGSLLRRVAHERQLAVLIIEHRLELLRQLASHVVVLHVGSILTEGSSDTVFRNPDVRKTLLGVAE